MSEAFFTALAVFLRIISSPAGNVAQKQLTARNNHPLVINFLTYLLLSLLSIYIATVIQWKEIPGSFWLYSVLGGIAGALGNGFLVKALQKGELSVLGPINSYKSIIGIIAAVFLLSEIPNLWGALGVALIVFGSYFVLDTTEERFTWALLKRRDIQFRLWAMILTAIEAVFIKKIIIASSVTIAFLSWSWFGAIFSFLLLFGYRLDLKKEVRLIKPSHFRKYLFLWHASGPCSIQLTIHLTACLSDMPCPFFNCQRLLPCFLGIGSSRNRKFGKN